MDAKASAILVLKKLIENEENEPNKTEWVKKQKLSDISWLADINFNLGDYQAANENYEKLIYLTKNYENRLDINYLDWKKIARNLIISNYKEKYRSKAENYQIIFEDVITEKSKNSGAYSAGKGNILFEFE